MVKRVAPRYIFGVRWSVSKLLRDLAHPFDGAPPLRAPELVQDGGSIVTSVAIDSRSLAPGALFVPLVAARDGHEFIAAALERGAHAVLLDHAHKALATSIPAGVSCVLVHDTLDALTRLASAQTSPEHPRICITGSNGKTTTRGLLGAVLEGHYQALQQTQGNLNNHLGVPLTLLGGPQDPDARLLEFGMSAPGENLHLARIFGPSIAVITSIALEHLETMGNLDNIARAEAEPLQVLAPGSLVLMPAGVPELERALDEIPSACTLKILRVGMTKDQGVADVTVQLDAIDTHTRGVVCLPDKTRCPLRLPIMGAHNLINAAYALCVGQHLGIDPAAMIPRLEAAKSVGDRGKVLSFGPHQIIADCYNANPGSMQAALSSLAKVQGTSNHARIAVLGDMHELGPSSAALHQDSIHCAKSLQLEGMVAIGPMSCQALDSLGPQAFALQLALSRQDAPQSPQEMASQIAAALSKLARPCTMLFKASRAMKLEAVIEALMAHEPSA